LNKAIYLPTGQNTVVLNEVDGYCEILLDGEYKTVSKSDISFEEKKEEVASFERLQENIFINCIKQPLSDILYSYNTNRLTPEPHQYKPLIKFLNSENSRILIADEVGLGKTIEAGMIYKEIDKREELKISLIVVPSSLTLKWKEELEIRFDEHFEIKKTNQFIHLIDEFENYSSSRFFNEKIIISYHTLRDERVTKRLKESFFEVDFLIMDEAHSMRNCTTSTFQSGRVITALSDHIVFLTATPVQNSLEDLFNILSMLDEDYFKDYGYFQRMVRPNAIIHKIIALLRNNHTLEEIQAYIKEGLDDVSSELEEIVEEIGLLDTISPRQRVEFIDRLTQADHLSFIINRTKKKDVGRSLPRNATSITVEITPAEQVYYDAVITFVKFIYPHVPPGFITIMPERMASSSMLASLRSFKTMKKSGKLFFSDLDDLDEECDIFTLQQEAMGYLDDVIEKGELIGDVDSKFVQFEAVLEEIRALEIKQLIVFSFFKKTLDYLEEKLISLGYSVGKIHGDFDVPQRFAVIKAFKRGEFDILLSSEVGSEGLDMQFCNVVINYDLPWNPMRVEQRIGRIDRIGQKFDKLHIFNLCITGSIEDRIFNRLYSKLGIFESSIGELEPILGNLEEALNIAELIGLSQEEIDRKIHLEELALRRRELEVKEQSREVEKLIGDDINFQKREDELFNPAKVEILQGESRKLFLDFLDKEAISYLLLKSGEVKLSSENLKKLFGVLKSKMSDRRLQPSAYREERKVLQQISRYKELKISFETNDNDAYETLYLYLNHPILSMIVKERLHKTLFSCVTHSSYENGYAVIYRVDYHALRSRSAIEVMIVDRELSMVAEEDYFTFIGGCGEGGAEAEVNFGEIKAKVTPMVIERVEKQKESEHIRQKRMIDIKIDSISSYYQKKIERTKRAQQSVAQEDVVRMRGAEVENLKVQRDKKIAELEGQKMVKSSFEILGMVKL